MSWPGPEDRPTWADSTESYRRRRPGGGADASLGANGDPGPGRPGNWDGEPGFLGSGYGDPGQRENRYGDPGQRGDPGRGNWDGDPRVGEKGDGDRAHRVTGDDERPRRASGKRTPGAHRASKPDGLVPGFGRLRSRDEREPGPRHMPEPYPADVPMTGDAGLRAGGYGLSTEGDLTEAEFAQADWRRGQGHPGQGQADQTGRPGPLAGSQAPQPAGSGSAGEDVASPSLVRSSGVMALGTLASRVTGLLRTLVLVAAVGQNILGDSYNNANTLPNTVYNLAIGGILTSVIVPLLVNASKRDADRGEKYDQRMFTLVTGALAVVTIVATLAADPIATLYDPSATGNGRHLLLVFAYFFIPQIFFYGVSSLASAILNARGHFAAPMWTPVVNNAVVIAVTGAFMAVAGGNPSVASGDVSNAEVYFLAIGTTLGIVAQTAALVPALRKVGFRWRPRFDFRRQEVGEIGRMSGWMFGYVLTTQLAFLVTTIVANTADHWGKEHHVGVGYSAYSYAWQLFQLPYAIVAISVITALLPRMSASASDGRYDLVRNDFSTGVRLGSVIVAPAALVLAAIGPALAVVMFSYGSNNVPSARYLGVVFAVFSLGLMPYMLFQLLLRVFYSMHDSKTPALIGVATMIANVGANLIAYAVFPPNQVVAALGAGFGLANLVGSVLAWRVLSKRLGGLAGRQISGSLLRMHVAAAPAALFALAVAVVLTSVFTKASILGAVVTVAVGGAGGLVLYVLFARLLHVTEVTSLTSTVRSRLRR